LCPHFHIGSSISNWNFDPPSDLASDLKGVHGVALNVDFPYGGLDLSSVERISIYCGGADTVIALTFVKIDELLEFLRENS
jgi:predicted GH43/DUF377 family glycosyl hydrolase